ncbi:MAG: VOC family protein [Bdellovibrionota bacterium]
MAGLQTYLLFNGNCEEAVKFYCQTFNGEVLHTSRYSDTPTDVAEQWKDKIIHTAFKIRGTELLASDSHSDNDVIIGNNIQLSLNYDKITDPTEAFNKLAQGGKIIMPLQQTFWAIKFGMLTDKFGVNWMFNQAAEKK